MYLKLNYIFLLILFTTIKKTTQIKNITVLYLEEESLSDSTSNELLFYLQITEYSKNQPIFIKIKDSNLFSTLQFKYCFLEEISNENFDKSQLIEIKEESKKENVYKIKIIKPSLIFNNYLALLIISENNFEREVTFINDEAINNLKPGEIIAIIIASLIIIGFFILIIYCCCCKPIQWAQRNGARSRYVNGMYINEMNKRNDPYYQNQMYYNQNIQGQMYYNQNIQGQMYYNMQGQMNYNMQGQNGAVIYPSANVGNSNVNLNENNVVLTNEKDNINQNK